MLGYRAYEVQNREKDIKLAQVSLIIVFGELDNYYHVSKLMRIFAVFIFCHSVKWIPNIWELRQSQDDREYLEWPRWIGKEKNICNSEKYLQC